MNASPVVIAACRPHSPAAAAGLRAGDRVVEIAGQKITRQAELMKQFSSRYAGDKVAMVVLRGKTRIGAEVQLTDKLAPYQHPLLGILPLRAAEHSGVTVRYVYPQSPAARAGIVAGDKLLKLDGQPLADRDGLRQHMAALEADQETEIQFRHADQTRTVKLTLGRLPDALPPAELPPAHPPIKHDGAKGKPGAAKAAKVKVGLVPLTVAERKNEVWAYVPEAFDPAVPHGLVVWLHGSAAVDRKELLARWKPLCDRYDLILAAPRCGDPAGWKTEDAPLVVGLIQQVHATYHVDGTRLVVCGRESGGTLACLLAFGAPGLLSAAAVIDAEPEGQPPDGNPLSRLAMYVAAVENSPHAAATARLVAQLRAKKIPVTLKSLGSQPRDLGDADLAELARWIDMLDRI